MEDARLWKLAEKKPERKPAMKAQLTPKYKPMRTYSAKYSAVSCRPARLAGSNRLYNSNKSKPASTHSARSLLFGPGPEPYAFEPSITNQMPSASLNRIQKGINRTMPARCVYFWGSTGAWDKRQSVAPLDETIFCRCQTSGCADIRQACSGPSRTGHHCVR